MPQAAAATSRRDCLPGISNPILGKSVTVENRAGGGGWIGWGSLAASKPDGYTIGYINAPSMFAGYLDKAQGGARKENLESFTPLINHVVDPNLWAVRPDSKFKTVKDVIDEAKRRPGTVTLNGGGHGTDDHVAALGIGANNGTSFQMVHFRGTPEGKTQVLAGNIEVLACNVSEVAEDIKAGQYRILGVMSAERSPFIPNGPTFREQGFNEVWAVSRGIAAPAGLPKDVETALTGYLRRPSARRSTGPRPRRWRSTRRSSRARTTASSSRTTSRPPRS